MTIQSLGFVEVKGFVTAVAVADAMMKTSSVRILMETKLDPGQVTITVEGDLGACEAAISAGAEVARSFGKLVGVLVKGKPDAAIEDLVQPDGPMADPSGKIQPGRAKPDSTQPVQVALDSKKSVDSPSAPASIQAAGATSDSLTAGSKRRPGAAGRPR